MSAAPLQLPRLEKASSERKLRHLEVLVNRKLDGLLQGDHQGLLPGAGGEAGDGRAYQPGDDVRRIDWNLTARSNHTQVRTTIADRELETWLVVDGSASLDFGTSRCEKRELAIAAAAAFGFLTCRSGNRLGAAIFDAAGMRILPPRSGRPAVLSVLHRLELRPRDEEVAPGDAAPSLADALRRVDHLARRRGLIVVISDLLDGSDWPRALRSLSARHDVVVVDVRDPREDDLPPAGLLMLVDPETGRRLEIQTDNRRIRRRFAEAAAAKRAATAQSVRAAGGAHLVLSTDRDWVLDVVRFATTRRRRR